MNATRVGSPRRRNETRRRALNRRNSVFPPIHAHTHTHTRAGATPKAGTQLHKFPLVICVGAMDKRSKNRTSSECVCNMCVDEWGEFAPHHHHQVGRAACPKVTARPTSTFVCARRLVHHRPLKRRLVARPLVAVRDAASAKVWHVAA